MATKTLSLRIDDELIERIDAVAEGKSRNAVIKRLIEAGLKAIAEEEETQQENEAKAASTLEALLEKVSEIEKKVDGAGEQIARQVVDGVSEQNNALFRDTTTQMTSAVLPQLNEMNRKLLDQLDERIEEMRSQPIALPESQVLVEGEPFTPALPAETHEEEEADPEVMGFFDKRAYNRIKALGYRMVK